MSRCLPGQPFPAVDLPRVGGGRVDNAIFSAFETTVLNVYRGLHCPRCRAQLGDLTRRQEDFAVAGAQVVSISTDPADRAEQAVRDWALGDMPVGYDLTIDAARGLGLFISRTIREAEPALFAEAAIFLVQRDGVLWGSSVNTFPFLRPTAVQLLDAIETRAARNYPPRGDA